MTDAQISSVVGAVGGDETPMLFVEISGDRHGVSAGARETDMRFDRAKRFTVRRNQVPFLVLL